MKKKIIIFTDEQAKELVKYPNQSEIIRNAFDVYNGHITPEVLRGLREAFKRIEERSASVENALTKIADAANISIDKHSEWGA